MPNKNSPVPVGFSAITPYLTVKNAARAIEFYQQAFGATERGRLTMPDGKIGHAELMVGGMVVMLADEFPEFGNTAPQTLNGTAVGFALYVANADAAFDRAVAAGATMKEPVGDKFWGDRAGSVVDPFGHKWTLLTRLEEVSFPEMQRRMAQMFAAGGKP